MWTDALTLAQDGGRALTSETAGEAVEGADGAQGTGGGAAPTGGGGLGYILPLMLVGFMALILFQALGQRKNDKKRRALLSQIKRYDRVQTIGGVIGTVMELKDTEVVLRTDEHSDTRIRFSRSAIQQVLTGGAEDTEAPNDEPVATTA